MKIILFIIITNILALVTTNAQTANKKSSNQIMNNTNSKAQDNYNGVSEFYVDGIKVILQNNPGKIISARVFITGGVDNYSEKEQGIENIALSVLTSSGSKNYPKALFNSITERKGIRIGASSSRDYSTISLTTLETNWNESWSIFSDLLINNSWDAVEFKNAQENIIAGIQQNESNPDSYLSDMLIDGLYKGTSYAKDPEGTIETINALTLDGTQAHFNKIFAKKKLLIVIVGNVTKEDLTAKISLAFKNLPEGKADVFVSNPPKINQPELTQEARQIATNYIMGAFEAPKSGTKEGLILNVAMSILSDRYFTEVRTKRNLSYAPQAFYSGNKNPYCGIYVSTTKPNDAISVMMDEVRKIKKEGFLEKELINQKSSFLTRYYMGMETVSTQANGLGVADLRTTWKDAVNLTERIESITLSELNSVFSNYANAIHWFYLGDLEQVDEKIFKSSIK